MKKRRICNIIVIASTLFIAACTAGQLNKLPSIKDADSAAEITIIRIKAFWGGGGVCNISLDDWEFVAMGNGNYATIKVRPGMHKINVYCRNSCEKEITVSCPPRSKSYISWYLSPAPCARMQVIDEPAALELIVKYKKIDIK
jgi:hypothetical protein